MRERRLFSPGTPPSKVADTRSRITSAGRLPADQKVPMRAESLYEPNATAHEGKQRSELLILQILAFSWKIPVFGQSRE
jgi:hypothetical protein